jgi:hypothetical protein
MATTYPSAILCRDKCLVVNLEHIKVMLGVVVCSWTTQSRQTTWSSSTGALPQAASRVAFSASLVALLYSDQVIITTVSVFVVNHEDEATQKVCSSTA